MKILQYPSQAAEKRLQGIVQRGLEYKTKDMAAVQKIINEVRKQGDEALIGYARRFDAPEMRIDQIRVTRAEMTAAGRQVDRRFTRALNCRLV